MMKQFILIVLISLINAESSTPLLDLDKASSFDQIEGKVFWPDLNNHEDFIQNTEILLRENNNSYKGFLRADGTFVISNVPKIGSFILEVNNPDYVFEQLKIEINGKGKIRARKFSNIMPLQVITVEYPLTIKPIAAFKYFQQREEWKIADFLLSPMFLMTALPLVLLCLLPVLMNDPDTKKVLENSQNLQELDKEMPDLGEMFSKLLSESPRNNLEQSTLN